MNLKSKDKKQYIQIEVKKSKLPLNLHGRYFYRTGSVKKEITGFELTEFIIKSTGTSYDEMISDIPREKLTFESFRKCRKCKDICKKNIRTNGKPSLRRRGRISFYYIFKS